MSPRRYHSLRRPWPLLLLPYLTNRRFTRLVSFHSVQNSSKDSFEEFWTKWNETSLVKSICLTYDTRLSFLCKQDRCLHVCFLPCLTDKSLSTTACLYWEMAYIVLVKASLLFKPNSASLSVFTHGGWLVCVLCVIKLSYNNHKHTFRYQSKRKATLLSDYVWNLKTVNKTFRYIGATLLEFMTGLDNHSHTLIIIRGRYSHLPHIHSRYLTPPTFKSPFSGPLLIATKPFS